MTVATINPEPADVVLMTERHRLIERCVYVCPKIGSCISENRSGKSEQNQRHTNNHGARNGIRPFWKKLAHSDEGAVRPSPIESQPPIQQTCHSLKELEIMKQTPAICEIIFLKFFILSRRTAANGSLTISAHSTCHSQD